eukprot:g8850.t1
MKISPSKYAAIAKRRPQRLSPYALKKEAKDDEPASPIKLEKEIPHSLAEGRDNSLNRVMEIQSWLGSYQIEQEAFNSFAVFSEVRLKEAFSVTQQVGLPSPQRTAVCCELLSKIAGIFGRFGDIITLIAFELMRGTYYGFDQVCIEDMRTTDGKKIVARDGPTKGSLIDIKPRLMMHWTPYYSLVKSLQADLTVAKRRLQAMEEAGTTAEQITQKRMRVMDKAVKSWQLQLLRRTFENWRRGHMEYRRIFQRLRRRRLIIWLGAWKHKTLLGRLARKDAELEGMKEEANMWQDAAIELKEQKESLEQQVDTLNDGLKDALDADKRQQQRNTAFHEAMGRIKSELKWTQAALKQSLNGQATTLGKSIYGEADSNIISTHTYSHHSTHTHTTSHSHTESHINTFAHTDTFSHTNSHTNTYSHRDSGASGHGTRMRHKAGINQGRSIHSPGHEWGGAGPGGMDGSSMGNAVKLGNGKAPGQTDAEYMTMMMKGLVEMMNHELTVLCDQNPDDEAFTEMLMNAQYLNPMLDKKKVNFKTINKYMPDEPVAKRVLNALGDDVPPVWATCNALHKVLAHRFAGSPLGDGIEKGDFKASKEALEELFRSETPEQEILKAWVNYHLDISSKENGCKRLWIENLSSNLRDSEEYAQLFDRLIRLKGENVTFVESLCEQTEEQDAPEEEQKVALVGSKEAVAPETSPESAEAEAEAGDNEVPAAEEKGKATIRELVGEELDLGKKADIVLGLACEQLGIDHSLLDAEEIVGMDADWNFTMLAYLFLRMPGLTPAFEEYLDDAKRYEFLRNATFVLNLQRTEQMDEAAERTYNHRLNFISTEMTKLKSQIDARVARDLTGHELYKQAAEKVIEMSYRELARRTRGMEGAVGNQELAQEKKDYTRMNYYKIKDLLKHDDDPEEELQRLESYLGSRFHDLRKIYKAYAAMGGSDGGGASSISMGEFMTLVKDSKITNNTFLTTDVDLIFIRTNWEVDSEGMKTNQANNPDRALTSNEYVEALVRCAYGRYKAKAKTNLTECVIKLFENNIIPYAQRSDADAFRKILASKKVRDIFAKHEKKLKRLYRHIAGDDGMINCKEFSDLLYRKKIVDGKTVTTKNVWKIFNNVQEDGDPEEEETDEGMEDMEMTYAEFLEALAAVAS